MKKTGHIFKLLVTKAKRVVMVIKPTKYVF